MKVDVLAGQVSYDAHLGPVVAALGPDAGAVHRSRRSMAQEGGPVLCASGGDALAAPPLRPLALMQHGVGQSYNGRGASRLDWGYVGGAGLEHVGLFLCVNADEAEAWRAVYPDAEVVVVGAPCMDEWHALTDAGAWAGHGVPTVAVSFHWKATATIESGTAWPEWRRALIDVAERAEERGYRLLGHEHPRWNGRLLDWWRRVGVETCGDWREVMQRASVYCADNSSTMYEFMATGRPVIGLRSAQWRTDVEHGLRFWRDAPFIDLHPEGGARALHGAIVGALRSGWQESQQPIVRRVYGRRLDGRSAARAADALRRWAAVLP